MHTKTSLTIAHIFGKILYCLAQHMPNKKHRIFSKRFHAGALSPQCFIEVVKLVRRLSFVCWCNSDIGIEYEKLGVLKPQNIYAQYPCLECISSFVFFI